jgi:hypothetical protein
MMCGAGGMAANDVTEYLRVLGYGVDIDNLVLEVCPYATASDLLRVHKVTVGFVTGRSVWLVRTQHTGKPTWTRPKRVACNLYTCCAFMC